MNTTNYYSNPYTGTIAGTADIVLTAYDTGGGGANTQTVTISFNKPVTNPVLHIDRMGGASSGAVTTSVWTLSGSTSTGGSVSFSKLSGNPAFSVTSNRFQRATTGAPGYGGSSECVSATVDDGNTACGSVLVTGTGITQLTFTVTFVGPSGTGDAFELKVSIPDTKVIYRKSTAGATGSFTFTGTNGVGGSTLDTSTSNPATSATYPLTSNTADTTITETAVAGYALSATSCIDQNSTAITSSLAGQVLTIPASSIVSVSGQTITCTFTNTRLPTLSLRKTSLGGVGGFTFTGNNGWSSQTITTVTAGTAVSGATQTLTAAATATTITETVPAGYAMTAASCTGLGTGGTATPNLGAGTITLDAAATAAGSNISCSITNSRLPTLSLSKTSLGGVGGFTFTGNNGWSSQTITTVTAGTAVSGATQTLAAAATATTITETVPAGYAMTAASCTGLGTGGTATPNLAAGTITLDAAATAAGSNISCSITNTRLPTVTVSKVSLGGVGAFTFSGSNGFSGGTITTVTAGTPVSGSTNILAAAATATTITEAIPAGYLLTAVTCSGLGSGGGYTPNLTTGAVLFDAAATAPGAAITCTFTNTVPAPQLSMTKTPDVASVDARGDAISYTISVSNTGNVAVSSITVSDPLGGVSCVTSGNATIAALAPAQTETCTLLYLTTQADLDTNGGGDGDIDNTATANGTYNVSPVTASASAAVTLVLDPELTIVKTANPAGPVNVGDAITYTYAVTNSGNVTMSGVHVDDLHGGSGPLPTPAGETLTDIAPAGDSTDAASNDGVWSTLAPGDSVTFTASYTVTQQDVNNQ